MIQGETLFRMWAPEESVWARWAKPVVFAQLRPALPMRPWPDWSTWDLSWAPPAGDTAIVVNLRGDESVLTGLALTARGYRPVPLYNACSDLAELVDTTSIMAALVMGAEHLQRANLPADAPPVFLLDAGRSGSGALPVPGRFDNRWIVFPQDFPSANFLLSRGLRTVLLVERASERMDRDLAHVMLRWEEGGVQLMLKDPVVPEPARPIKAPRPLYFRSALARVLVAAGLRRNSAGGFGAVIPEPSSGVGYG